MRGAGAAGRTSAPLQTLALPPLHPATPPTGREVPYESEDDLRAQGLAKTPDVRLGLPIGVFDRRAGAWREVNWVDSKAMFGDRHTWDGEHLAQLEGYVHR